MDVYPHAEDCPLPMVLDPLYTEIIPTEHKQRRRSNKQLGRME